MILSGNQDLLLTKLRMKPLLCNEKKPCSDLLPTEDRRSGFLSSPLQDVPAFKSQVVSSMFEDLFRVPKVKNLLNAAKKQQPFGVNLKNSLWFSKTGMTTSSTQRPFWKILVWENKHQTTPFFVPKFQRAKVKRHRMKYLSTYLQTGGLGPCSKLRVVLPEQCSGFVAFIHNGKVEVKAGTPHTQKRTEPAQTLLWKQRRRKRNDLSFLCHSKHERNCKRITVHACEKSFLRNKCHSQKGMALFEKKNNKETDKKRLCSLPCTDGSCLIWTCFRQIWNGGPELFSKHTSVSHVLICPLNSRFAKFKRILLGITFSN